jgi:hypothetical protein
MNLVEDFDLLQSAGHYEAYERPASAAGLLDELDELPSTSGGGMLSLEATIRQASRSVALQQAPAAPAGRRPARGRAMRHARHVGTAWGRRRRRSDGAGRL